MTRFAFMFLFFSIFTIAAAFAQSSGKQIFPYNYKVETLPNGLKVIMIPMQHNGLVAYYTIVRTGSRDEYEPGHSGFTHFFEHMMFRGTKKYPGDVYDRLVTSMGANANAYTTDDYTAYHLNIAKDDLDKVMELESDRFQNLAYPEAGFKTESQAVYGEYRKGKTSPFLPLEEKLRETAFDEHTYRHTTIGFEKDIAAMPTMYQYSLNFFKRYYRPDNVVILVAGDVNPQQFMDKVKHYYGNWQKGYTAPIIPKEPEQKKERTAKVQYPGKTLPLIAISYKGAAFDPNSREDVAGMMLGDLAFGSNSALYKRLYLKEQKVQMLEPEFDRNRDPNLWTIWVQPKSEKDINYVRDQVFGAAQQFQTTPVDATQLNNLKKRMKYEFLMNLDTPNKVAGGLARIVAITGGIEAVDKYFKTMEQITPQDIQNAARKYLIPERRTVVTLTGSK